jgi:rRNA maturation endonuclease Nob1
VWLVNIHGDVDIGNTMGLRDRISDALSGEGSRTGNRYKCERCGAEYERLRTPCEDCGSDVMRPLQ